MLEHDESDTSTWTVDFYENGTMLDCGSADVSCNSRATSEVTYQIAYETYTESGERFQVYSLEFVASERLNGTVYHCRLLCGFSFCNITPEITLSVQGNLLH